MNALTRTLAWHIGVPLVDLLHRVGACSCLFAFRGFERLRWQLGRFGAWGRYEAARRSVPAYRNFVGASRATRIDDVPMTDKATYVKVYDLEARCEGGRLPASGVIIDESSGSSGLPTNWVRGIHERETNRRTIRMGLQRRLGDGPLFFINAFALGPWATGINLTLSLSSWGRVKSLGPDIEKIGNTLRQFGPDVHYVIMGYPPFLKQLVDQLDVDWAQYQVSMVFGGEGMSESMRRYLQAHGIRRVFGSYGASDLELNIAAETEFTIALRRHLEEDPRLRRRLLRHPGTAPGAVAGAVPGAVPSVAPSAVAGAVPMIFQFNPADFYLETAATGELLVTVCRPGHVTPKVRYNIHDLGHVMRRPEVAAVLRAEGIDPDALEAGGLDLPLLFLYGRSDASVAYYGCKISPADIQEALFRVPELAAAMDAHQLEVLEDQVGDKRFLVHLEVAAGAHPDGLIEWSSHFFDALAAVNQDFRESRRMAPAAKAPKLVLHAQGAGPFAGADIRIKRQYIAAPAA